MSTQAELSRFLGSVERRAYKQAMFAVKDRENALDIVQDAMLKLADKYGTYPSNEWPMLFQRILQNKIRDFYRRQKVRSIWTSLFASSKKSGEEEEYDLLETLEIEDPAKLGETPEARFQQKQLMALIEKLLANLPQRQREAFFMRYWEGMSVAETAEAMGCTEGSVKTHCSRATHTLASALTKYGVTL